MSSNSGKLNLFRKAVLSVVRRIPRGSVLSYGAVAKQAGYPGAARAVGTLMKQNRSARVPCHRVVRSDGKVGEYVFGGPRRKVERLVKEGVVIHGRKVAPACFKSVL